MCFPETNMDYSNLPPLPLLFVMQQERGSNKCSSRGGNANKSCSSVYLTYIFHQRRSPRVAAVTDLECRSLDEVRLALVKFRQGLIELRALLFEAPCPVTLLIALLTFFDAKEPFQKIKPLHSRIFVLSDKHREKDGSHRTARIQ